MSLPAIGPVPCWYRRLPSRAVPLKLFQALYGDEPSAFLYESLEAHGGRGRYSFIGAKPRAVFRCRGQSLELLLDAMFRSDAVLHRGLACPECGFTYDVTPFQGDIRGLDQAFTVYCLVGPGSHWQA